MSVLVLPDAVTDPAGFLLAVADERERVALTMPDEWAPARDWHLAEVGSWRDASPIFAAAVAAAQAYLTGTQ